MTCASVTLFDIHWELLRTWPSRPTGRLQELHQSNRLADGSPIEMHADHGNFYGQLGCSGLWHLFQATLNVIYSSWTENDFVYKKHCLICIYN